MGLGIACALQSEARRLPFFRNVRSFVMSRVREREREREEEREIERKMILGPTRRPRNYGESYDVLRNDLANVSSFSVCSTPIPARKAPLRCHYYAAVIVRQLVACPGVNLSFLVLRSTCSRRSSAVGSSARRWVMAGPRRVRSCSLFSVRSQGERSPIEVEHEMWVIYEICVNRGGRRNRRLLLYD